MERLVRVGVFGLCLLPFIWLVYAAATAGLGPDPAESVMHHTGEWALRLLLLTLLVSPLRQWTGWRVVPKLRRMLGLYTFFYACIHLLSFCQFYVGWALAVLAEELVERPYITVGFAAWLLLLPLAVTSTRGMQRRLRGNWQRLHRLVYAVAALVCCHILWQVRSDIGEALVYIALFVVLLAWRVKRLRARQKN